MRRHARAAQWALVGAITVGAAVLRLAQMAKVPPDPFYDAAVRSMSTSWHNFFFGAFEPGGTVSIDKPPIDLWFQVASVKLLGFTDKNLKLPEALAGILAVPLTFEVVRRMWSATAGIAASVALAVLPVEVITSRSDTMDAVMMVMLVIALLFVVRAVETNRTAWLLAGAAMLGVAFDVKLLESIVALPGIAVLAFLGLQGSRVRRLARLALAAVVYVVVALSWLTATLLFPAHDRPYAIGSTNGSAWNAAFVFNGTDRLGSKSPEPTSTVYKPGHRYPTATQSERDHIPILPPSPTRLLARIGPLSGERLGLEVLIALLLGIPPFALALLDRGGGEDEQPEAVARRRMRRAAAAGIGLWMLTGIVLFSHMVRLHPRYVEGFTPAVAAMMGIGVAWAASLGRDRRSGALRLGFLIAAMAITVYYTERLLYGRPTQWWVGLAGALCAIAFALLARVPALSVKTHRLLAPAAVMTSVLVAVLSIPIATDATVISDRVGDAGYVGALPGEEQRLVSAYLRAHQGDAHFEFAAESATQIGSLIVQDGRPVAMLTTYDARVLDTVAKLKQLIAQGKVRYAFLNSFCGHHAASLNPACSEPAKWVRAHGTDVSRQAGLHEDKILWRLPGVHE
jgi:4-amino-4-deoxy-L-arabinose transferase-like glycosyltransferase